MRYPKQRILISNGRTRPVPLCREPWYRYDGAPCENCGEYDHTHYRRTQPNPMIVAMAQQHSEARRRAVNPTWWERFGDAMLFATLGAALIAGYLTLAYYQHGGSIIGGLK